MRRDKQAQLLQALGEAVDVALHDRSEIGVHHRRAHPFEFAEFRRHFVADASEGFGEFLGDDASGDRFVFGADETIEKTNRDGFDTGGAQGADRFADGLLIEGGFHRTVVTHSFRDFEAKIAGDQHRRFVGLQIIEVGTLLPPDLQQVTKTVRGDQAGFHAAVLDEGVGGNRGAVAEVTDVGGRHADPSHRFLEALRDATRRVVRGGGDFPDLDAAALVFEQAHVGESAT